MMPWSRPFHYFTYVRELLEIVLASRQIYSETRLCFLQTNGARIFSDTSLKVHMRMIIDQRFAVTTPQLRLYRIPDLPIVKDTTLGLSWFYGYRQISKNDLAIVGLFPMLRSLSVQIRLRDWEGGRKPEEAQRVRNSLQKTDENSLEVGISWI